MNRTIVKLETLTILIAGIAISHLASAQSVWNNSSGNWSTPANWLPNVTPTASGSVLFNNNTAAAATAGAVDNTVDAGFGGFIASLQYANTNAGGAAGFYHTTQIVSGMTLTNSGSLTVGTLIDSGGACQVNATVTGAGAALVMTNTAANLIVNQASATGGAHLAVLNMTNLDTFTASIGRIEVGVANGVNRAEGLLALAKTNTITLSGSAPQIYMGFNNGNNDGSTEFPVFYLGQKNTFFVDSITISADKQGNPASRWMFNPVFTNNNPTAYFRGIGGSNSRVSTWTLGNNGGQSTTGSISDGTNDFTFGTLDAMVATMTLGISEKAGASGSGSGNGTFTFSAGSNNVNTLYLGFGLGNTGSSVGNGTMNVNGSATLVVNNAICLSYWTAPSTAYGNANLNINGGTVFANTITNGVTDPNSIGFVNANITMNGGFLGITSLLGTIGTPAWPLGIVTLNNSTLQLPVSGLQTNLSTYVLNFGGATNIINISSVPATVTNYPAQFPLISYVQGGSSFNFNIGVSNLPGTYQGYISNNTAMSRIDLVLTSGPTAINALEWTGSAGSNWDTTSANWLSGSSPVAYIEGVSVLFDDNATGPTTINLTAPRSPASVTVSNNMLPYSFSGSGVIGSGNLVKDGAGTLLFTNSGNAFFGGVAINAGTVQFGAGGTSGILPPTGNVVDNGNLVFDHSNNDVVPNTISGAGTLTKIGSNILTLAASNSFNGAVVVNGGTLLLNGSLAGVLTNAVGTTVGGAGTNNGPVTVSGMIQPSATTGTPAVFTAGGDLTLNAGGTLAFDMANGSNDMIQVGGNLNANNNLISLNFSTIPQIGTPYALVNYQGIKNGSFNAIAAGTHYIATVNQGASPISVTLSGSGANLEWTSTTSAVWDNGATSNWLNQGAGHMDVFYTGDNVLFDESVPGVVTNITLAAGTLVPSLITVNATNENFSLGGPGTIGGGAGVQKNGPGTLALNSANTYSGNTVVSGGILQLGANGANGGGITYIASGATLDLNGHSSGSVNVSGAGVGGNGAIINSAPSVTGDQQAFGAGIYIYMQSDTTFGCPNRWDIRNGNLSSGNGNPYNLNIVGSNLIAFVNATIDSSLGNIDIQGGTLGLQTTTLSDSPGWAGDSSHTITVESNAMLELDISVATTSLGKSLIFKNCSTLQNDGAVGDINGPFTLQGTVTNNNTTALQIDSAIGGSGNLVKMGASLTLTASNTYTGGTFINGGSLALTGAGSISKSSNLVVAAGGILDLSARTDATLTLASGQTLLGNGTINGTLVTSAGSTVSAGTNSTVSGSLTVTNGVTLNGNALMKLNVTTGTNDLISAINGTGITYGGTLTVTNISATPLVAGSSFKLFNAATYAGSFASIIPATPGAGLAWSTNGLNNGVLSVISSSVPQPGITTISLSGSNLVINGTNGLAGEQYNVLMTTNLGLPVSSWTVLPTNTFMAGNFSITNTVNQNAPQSFYILRVP